MEKELKLVYRHIPSEIIVDFENLESEGILIKEDPLDYFSGGPSDIVLYINQHSTELIISSLLLPAVYDLIKATIKSAWKKLIFHYKKKNRQLEKEYNCLKIELDIDSERKMEFRLDGDIDPLIVNDISEKLFDYLQNQEIQKRAFENQNNIWRNNIKPTIRIRYNKLKNEWEPVTTPLDNDNSKKSKHTEFDS
jgi:hypothetical protein